MISTRDIPVEVITIPLMITLFVFVVAILLFIFIRYVFISLGFYSVFTVCIWLQCNLYKIYRLIEDFIIFLRYMFPSAAILCHEKAQILCLSTLFCLIVCCVQWIVTWLTVNDNGITNCFKTLKYVPVQKYRTYVI